MNAIPALISCPACGRQCSRKAAACPACAEPIAPSKTNTQGINLRDPVHIVGVVISVVIFLGTILIITAAILGG